MSSEDQANLTQGAIALLASFSPSPTRSPIDYVPMEVLESILLYTCDDTPLILPPSRAKSRFPLGRPLLALELSWVCRRWNVITLANARFWTPPIIEIVLEDYEYRDPMDLDEEDGPELQARKSEKSRLVAKTVAILRCYLARSGPAALPCIEFECYMVGESEWEDSIGDVLRCIAPTLSRWQRCTIPVCLANNLAELACGAEPLLLERAKVAHSYGPYTQHDAFAHAPRLRHWEGSVLRVTLPWSQLTCMYIDVFTPISDILKILPYCQQVVEVDMFACEDAPGVQPISSQAALLRLESMSACVSSCQVLRRIFSSITAPDLQRLALAGASGAETALSLGEAGLGLTIRRWPIVTFETMLTRSQCVLKSFLLQSIMMPRDDVRAIIERLPCLSDFGIREPWRKLNEANHRPTHVSAIGNTVLRLMTAEGGNAPNLLPELRTLEIEGVVRFDYALLINMLRSRTNPKLEHVHLCLYPDSWDINDATAAELEDIMGEKSYRYSADAFLLSPWSGWKERRYFVF